MMDNLRNDCWRPDHQTKSNSTQKSETYFSNILKENKNWKISTVQSGFTQLPFALNYQDLNRPLHHLNSAISKHYLKDASFDKIDKTKNVIEHIQKEILKIKNLIKNEENSRDNSVNEYLKLTSDIDEKYIQKIRVLFEKKNKNSTVYIEQLQKKIDCLTLKMKELETMNSQYRGQQSSQIVNDLYRRFESQNSGISGSTYGSTTTKSKESTYNFCNKNTSTFSRNDNLNPLLEKKVDGSYTISAYSSKFLSNEGKKKELSDKSTPNVKILPYSLNKERYLERSCHGLDDHQGSSMTDLSNDDKKLKTKVEKCIYHENDIEVNHVDIFSACSGNLMSNEYNKNLLVSSESIPNVKLFPLSSNKGSFIESTYHDIQEHNVTNIQNETENGKTLLQDRDYSLQQKDKSKDCQEIISSWKAKIVQVLFLVVQSLNYSTIRSLVKIVNVSFLLLYGYLILIAKFVAINFPLIKSNLKLLYSVAIAVTVLLILKYFY